MNTDDNEILMKVFSTIFEDFAFMFVEEPFDLENESPGECIRAEINFESKNQKGYLEVVAPLKLCNETAENILGTNIEELPANAGENALKELLNISCGYFLAEKFGTDEIFNLSIPKTNQVSENAWNLISHKKRHATFLVDESPVLTRFVLM